MMSANSFMHSIDVVNIDQLSKSKAGAECPRVSTLVGLQSNSALYHAKPNTLPFHFHFYEH